MTSKNDELAEELEESSSDGQAGSARKPRAYGAKAAKEPASRPTRVLSEVREKPVSFDVWVQRRGIRNHHRRGIAAHFGNIEIPRPMDQWDKAFKEY